MLLWLTRVKLTLHETWPFRTSVFWLFQNLYVLTVFTLLRFDRFHTFAFWPFSHFCVLTFLTFLCFDCFCFDRFCFDRFWENGRSGRSGRLLLMGDLNLVSVCQSVSQFLTIIPSWDACASKNFSRALVLTQDHLST